MSDQKKGFRAHAMAVGVVALGVGVAFGAFHVIRALWMRQRKQPQLPAAPAMNGAKPAERPFVGVVK